MKAGQVDFAVSLLCNPKMKVTSRGVNKVYYFYDIFIVVPLRLSKKIDEFIKKKMYQSLRQLIDNNIEIIESNLWK